jgi:hypothetical protein
MESILDRIDDAVNQRCACGCGATLDPNGPSQWFASPDCQRIYSERQTTDPYDVYNRPDAASYPNFDGATVPLSEPRHWLADRYLNAPPSAHAPAYRLRESAVRPDGRIPYQYLSAGEQEALHAWCALHDVDHAVVPIDARIELDEATNEWLITVHMQRDGHSYLDENGEVAREIVRRPNRAELPWPRREEPEVRAEYRGLTPTRMWIDDVEITDFVRDVQFEPVYDDSDVTRYGPTDWRDQVTRGHIAAWDETHEWVGEQAHERIQRLMPPEWTVPETGWVAERVAELMAEHLPEMPPLEPFQRQFLDAFYSMPWPTVPPQPSPEEVMDNVRRYMPLLDRGPTLFGSVGEPIRVGEYEIPVRYSPMVPDGQVVVVSAEMMHSLDRLGADALAGMTVTSEYDFMRDQHRLRVAAPNELVAHRQVSSVFSDSIVRAAERARREAEQALAIVLRNQRFDAEKDARKARMSICRKDYRSRQLARRRRNRR